MSCQRLCDYVNQLTQKESGNPLLVFECLRKMPMVTLSLANAIGVMSFYFLWVLPRKYNYIYTYCRRRLGDFVTSANTCAPRRWVPTVRVLWLIFETNYCSCEYCFLKVHCWHQWRSYDTRWTRLRCDVYSYGGREKRVKHWFPMWSCGAFRSVYTHIWQSNCPNASLGPRRFTK